MRHILFVSLLFLYSRVCSDPVSDEDIKKQLDVHGNILAVAEKYVEGNEKDDFETALYILATGTPFGFRTTPTASIEEKAWMRRIIFRAARKLYDKGVRSSHIRNNTLLYKRKSLANKPAEAKHQKLVHALVKERLQAFEAEPLKKFKNGKYLKLNQKKIDSGVTLSANPYHTLGYFIRNNVLNEKSWQRLYFSLWSIAGAQDKEYVYKTYRDIIQILQENWEDFDSSLQRPISEFGFFPDAKAKVINPVESKHTSLVFGGEDKGLFRDDVYVVNVVDQKPVDMLADMTNPEQLRSIPSNHFQAVFAEHIPAMDYYTPQFFKNAARILKKDGKLIVNDMDYMEKPPYHISDIPSYFKRNGFVVEKNAFCDYPRNHRYGGRCWHLKKLSS